MKFNEKYGLEGSVISAVDLIKGLGKLLGLEVINVAGATGYYDTNYEGKADAALAASIFHYKEVAIPDLKQYLNGKGIAIRI
jgi:2,3-bisphosphoglycerate-independent phosphoglycerate mutase